MRLVVLSKTAKGIMSGEENKQMCGGQDWVCFDVEKEYYMADRKIRLFGHIVRKNSMQKLNAAQEDGRRAAKGHTCNDLIPGFERMDKAGHGVCIPTDDRSGEMAGKVIAVQIAPPD